MEANNMNMGHEFDWDAVIKNDSTFELLPEGDYAFTVKSFERARHTPREGGKLPACNKAVLTIEVRDVAAGKRSTITHNLFLHSSCEGMLCSFFTAIGQRKKGEPLKMNWNMVPGSTGRCKVVQKKNFNNDDKHNEISRFYEPGEAKPQTGFGAQQTDFGAQQTGFGGGFRR